MPLDAESAVHTRVGFAFLIRSLGDEALRERYRTRNGQFVELMTGLLTEARDHGALDPSCDPRQEAVALFALVNGLKEPLLLGDQTPVAATAVVDEALARLSVR